jgi:hypothetical protein
MRCGKHGNKVIGGVNPVGPARLVLRKTKIV